MNITKDNFDDLLPTVKEAIYECDFLAVDTEFTGLYAATSTETAYDTMEERYEKLLKLCSQFLITQFGISTFKYHQEEKKYTHKDFNFYVFPRQNMQKGPDIRFLCQSSSLQFLASHRFDFNKCIYEGIPYLTYSQEEELKTYLSKKYKVERKSLSNEKENKPTVQQQVDIPDDQKDFMSEIHKQVESFMKNTSENVLNLKPCTGYQRKLVYDSIQQKHPTGIEMNTIENEEKERFITIIKCSVEDRLKKLNMKEECDLDDVESSVGFRKVMDFISDSKKLVLGHNMYLDIFHTVKQFFFPLPKDLKEFKSMIRMTFPHLLDTKSFSKSDAMKPFIDSSVLADLLKQVRGKEFNLPVISPAEGFTCYDLEDKQAHEAGFDAFMTGVCFIGLSSKLGSLQSPPIEHVDTSSKLLSRYVNRFNVMRHYEITNLNLSGPDPTLNRDHVFYISFPQEWKTVDLVELFCPYGNINVNWLDDVSALAALKTPENSLSAKKGLLHKANKIFQVKSFTDYQKSILDPVKVQNETNNKVTPSSSDSRVVVPKRRSSGSSEMSGSFSSMEIIQEVENEAETTESCSDFSQPPPKKLKSIDEEQEVVSSTLFEENNEW